uniref:Uncharacterized protein n=1 Tax=Anopheles minimus TaxID=112268 RepID=A0A182WNB2_9DIPT
MLKAVNCSKLPTRRPSRPYSDSLREA